MVNAISTQHVDAIKNIDEAIINAIQLINSNKDKFTYIGVNYGILGLSLFNFYLYEFTSENDYKLKASSLIEEAVSKLNDGYVSDSIYREIIELGWLLMVSKKNGWLDFEIEDQMENIDLLVFDVLNDSYANLNFDPVTGALGCGYYLLERVQYSNEIVDKLEELLNFLDTISHKNNHGTYWHSKLKGDDSIYLGITHGLANIILFLIELNKVDGFRGNEKIHDLIQGACSYIMNVRLENAPLVFPTVVGKIEIDIYPRNYCYGDFGTLYGLMRGYQFLDDGLNVEKCVLLFEEIEAKGYDAPYLSAGQSLLYGNAGLAMLFRKFNQHHPSNAFVEAYEKRIDKILETYDSNAEWMGFTGYWNQELDYINYTFNEGIIGIVIELMHLAKPEMDCKFEEFFYLKN